MTQKIEQLDPEYYIQLQPTESPTVVKLEIHTWQPLDHKDFLEKACEFMGKYLREKK